MKKLVWLALAASVAVFTVNGWRTAHWLREPAGEATGVDAERAVVERVLERTLRESRAGVEMPAVVAAPAPGARPDTVAAQPVTAVDDPRGAAGRSGSSAVVAPQGYSFGTYRGSMQRAPSSGEVVRPPPQNPAWLDPAAAPEALLEQATRSGRDFTFAVLRLGPRANLQALDGALRALGARIEGVTGEYARVRVSAERGRLESIAGLPGVFGLGALPPGQKAPESFVQAMRSRGASELAAVYITLMSDDPTGEWRRALAGMGIVVGAFDSDLRSFTANMPTAALAQVMAADYVMTIEPIPVITANHASSVPVMGVDGLRQYVPAEDRFSGLTGEGLAVAVLDTGLNTRHVDIAHGRESICGASFVADEHWDLWLDMDGHGTHVFGTVAGAGRTDPLLAGIAPGLSHLRFGKVLSAHGFGSGEDIRRAMDHFSRPTSCAWQGTVSDAVTPLIVNMSLSASALHFSGRGVGERKLDAVVHSDSQLYVVAQANSGLHGFSNYGTAKNSLAVGAVDDSGIIAGFSSHGPTADGRLAPNVVGTGVALTAARGQASLTGHDTFSGTSMASPSVAGVAALLMQARPEFRNRPALARARLMASAIRPDAYFDSGKSLPGDNSAGPGEFNNLYGLGLVSARTAVFSNDSAGGWLNGSASAEPGDGAYEYVDIDVPEDASRLDVVLTWDEQPADTLTRSVLANIDLWADRGADCAVDACGEHASRSQVDNVEWLLIEDPAPGVYRIKAVPVETYGESVAAAVAWTIRRGEATPRLEVHLEETSPSGADSRYVVVDVTVESSGYVASGTTIHLGCRIAGESACFNVRHAFLPYRSRVFRGDGQSRPLPYAGDAVSKPISVGEIAAGSPRRAQLWFLRDEVPSASTLHVAASAWNALAAARSIELSADGAQSSDEPAASPSNDGFSASERLSGGTGETRLDLALASREPGEPRVSAGSRTLWYEWDAPAKGLFRFRVREADSGKPATVDFALFSGDTLAALEPVTEKRGSEISFDALAGARLSLRIASGGMDRYSQQDWDLPVLALEWEPADVRPGNDDFDFAGAIGGESGSVSSTNEGATLEQSEFWGGLAATVWYEWTAAADGFAEFAVDSDELTLMAFRGADIDGLRLGAEGWEPGDGAMAFAVRRGDVWRIAVASEDADASGLPFTLSWETHHADPRAERRYNDFFADAVPIDGSEGTVANLFRHGDYTIPYSVEALEPPATGIATGWWVWTAPRDGRFTWRMDGSTAYRLAFFTGDSLDNLQPIGTLVGGSALVLDAAADTRYWIALGRAPEEVGTDPLRPGAFSWGVSPGNDDRAQATSISGSAGSVGASLVHATAQATEPRSAVGLESVWWTWRAPATGWYRFSVEGDPLHGIVQIFPGGDSEVASSRVIGDSERSFLANGRVDVRVFVRAGERYDIRLSRRPGVDLPGSDTLNWAPSDAPAYLSYKGAITEQSLMSNPVFDGLRSPRHLAMTDDGMYLFSTTDSQLYAFVRDAESGELALAYRTSSEENRDAHYPVNLGSASHTLWWSPLNETLFALAWCGASYSFALPDVGTTLDVRRIEEIGFPGSRSCGDPTAVGDRDGKHLYAIEASENRLLLIGADSPTSLTHLQTVSVGGVSGDNRTVVPGIVRPVDLALAPDGRHLYLADEFGLFVFSRDTSSGGLSPVGEVHIGSDPGGPFFRFSSLRHVSTDADGTVLFVAGTHTENSVTDTAIAVFDISADPSNPAHLDTLTGFYFHEADRGTLNAWNHLQPRPRTFQNCFKPMAHGELPAVDVFCSHGYFVVQWNPGENALEVTDFAVSGDRDRFGNPVPVLGLWDRRMAHSPDGAHVYRTTHRSDQGQPNAIHVFERAFAQSAEDETASPSFASGRAPGNRDYTVGAAIDPLTLPAAAGGDGPLTYSLTPSVPGLSFNTTSRRLSGTPTTAGTYDMTYRVRDVDGDTDSLTFAIAVAALANPDLVVESPSASNDTLRGGASFTFRASVRNRGDGPSAATTLRYYRSTNATISTSDTAVGTDTVGALPTSGTGSVSVELAAPPSAGTYHYGACVDAVAGESDTANNCSSGVSVSVTGGETGSGGDGACVEVNDVIELGEGESCTITQALVDKYGLNGLSVNAGDTATCSGGTVRLSFLNSGSIQLNGLTIRCR